MLVSQARDRMLFPRPWGIDICVPVLVSASLVNKTSDICDSGSDVEGV